MRACRLLAQVEAEFAQCQVTDVLLGPAIQAGCEALKAAGCAGKLFVLHASLPSLECPGRLRNRDERKLLGTDKEKARLLVSLSSLCFVSVLYKCLR